jgi:hypothetical protein
VLYLNLILRCQKSKSLYHKREEQKKMKLIIEMMFKNKLNKKIKKMKKIKFLEKLMKNLKNKETK